VSTPEIAFTGDTTADFILDPDNADALQAKILVVEVFCFHLSLYS
jgi:ribonuclease Z